MAQTLDPSLVASGKSGTVLIADINAITASILSSHRGASRPTYAVEGTIWQSSADDKYYVYDGSTDVELAAYLGNIPPVITRLTTGTGATYTTPAGVKALLVRVQGAGGGSGDATGGGAGTTAMSMAAGAGGYVEKFIASPAASYTYTIGAAGAGGDGTGTLGTAGGTTTFADGVSLTLSASGGTGTAAAVSTSSSTVINSVAGGAASGGDVNIAGGASQRGQIISGAPACYPIGGHSMMGIGGPNISNNGATPPGYGGGASGATRWGTTGTSQGADGAPALIEIWEYY